MKSKNEKLLLFLIALFVIIYIIHNYKKNKTINENPIKTISQTDLPKSCVDLISYSQSSKEAGGIPTSDIKLCNKSWYSPAYICNMVVK